MFASDDGNINVISTITITLHTKNFRIINIVQDSHITLIKKIIFHTSKMYNTFATFDRNISITTSIDLTVKCICYSLKHYLGLNQSSMHMQFSVTHCTLYSFVHYVFFAKYKYRHICIHIDVYVIKLLLLFLKDALSWHGDTRCDNNRNS